MVDFRKVLIPDSFGLLGIALIIESLRFALILIAIAAADSSVVRNLLDSAKQQLS